MLIFTLIELGHMSVNRIYRLFGRRYVVSLAAAVYHGRFKITLTGILNPFKQF